MRPVKLEFFDHPFTCPICKADIVYTSMQTVIVHSQRTCPSCQGELLIEQGAITAISTRKPPRRESLAKVRSKKAAERMKAMKFNRG